MVDEAITTEEEKRQAKAEAAEAKTRLRKKLTPPTHLRYEASPSTTYETMRDWGEGWNDKTGRFDL